MDKKLLNHFSEANKHILENLSEDEKAFFNNFFSVGIISSGYHGFFNKIRDCTQILLFKDKGSDFYDDVFDSAHMICVNIYINSKLALEKIYSMLDNIYKNLNDMIMDRKISFLDQDVSESADDILVLCNVNLSDASGSGVFDWMVLK